MKVLDEEIRKVHESYWDTQRQAAQNKAVLLVEGDDDHDVIQAIFDRRTKSWERRARIIVAGGRKNVIERMRTTFPTAWAIVDRDTWSDAQCAEHCNARPSLYITRGWCLENMFLQPGFLEQYDAQTAALVLARRERERWVRAGAFWWALQRTREAQQSWQDALGWTYGKPREDLDLASAERLVASLHQRIPRAVQVEACLDIDTIAQHFEKRLNDVLSLPDDVQWLVGVHGKCVFNEVLVPALNQIHGQRHWRRELAKSNELGRPAPLDALMAVLFP